MLEDILIKFFLKYNLQNSSNKLLIAFSGGLDSTCLLHCVNTLRKNYPFSLIAAHINHQWRGEESFKDQEFVTEFCNNLNIKLYIRHLDPDLPKTELVAREKRYEALNNIAREQNVNAILTAHTQSDQVETILFRILKGTGTSGLIGIPEMRPQEDGPTLYRPLLEISREEIKAYLSEHHLEYCEDKTNEDTNICRNSIRHELLPALKKYNCNVEEALLKLSYISSQNDNMINHFLEPVYKQVFHDESTLLTSEYLNLEDFVKPHILMKLLHNNEIEHDYKTIQRLSGYIDQTSLTPSGKRYSLLQNYFLHISNQYIKITSEIRMDPIQSFVKIDIPGITEFKELNLKLKVTEFKPDDLEEISFPEASSDIALVDLRQINTNLYLRTRQAGDIINPLGMKGHMKLKKYLINHYTNRQTREVIPVIAADNEIYWVIGVGLSDKVKVINTPTHVFEIIRG